MRSRLLYLILAGFMAAGGMPARAGEETGGGAPTTPEEVEKRTKERQAAREKSNQPHTDEITVDGEKIPVKEPVTAEEALSFTGDRRVRDVYEFSPDDFDIVVRDRWSINLSDFKFDRPRYISSEVTPGTTHTWFGFSFSITNSATKPRRIVPTFTAVTNRGSFNVASGGFIPERVLADSIVRPMAGSSRISDKELISKNLAPLESVIDLITGSPDKPADNLKPTAAFEPGQTRWGAAIWSEFDNHFAELKIVVKGLTNSHKLDEKLQRVLVLTFERNSDGFNVNESELKFKSKKWEYTWMWDQDIGVPLPADAKDPQIKVQLMKTPAGSDRLLWAFPFEIKNSTHTNQDISLMSVTYALSVEVDVGGTKVPVEVRVLDDGSSSIYKAALMKDPMLAAEAAKDRFASKTLVDGSKTLVERHKISIEAGKAADKNWAIFDQNDIDWADAVDQIEAFLSRGLDKAALAKQFWENAVKDAAKTDPKLLDKNPGNLYNPRRALNEDELKAVKEQIVKALPEALDKAKVKKTILAYFNAVSGMSTGEFRISRSYRIPGVVDESWLKAWEEPETKP